jgi:hypothetical protein
MAPSASRAQNPGDLAAFMGELGELRRGIELERDQAVAGIAARVGHLRELLAAKEELLLNAVATLADSKLRAVSQQQEQVAHRLAAPAAEPYPLVPCTSARFICLPDCTVARESLQVLGHAAVQFYQLALDRDQAEAHHWLGMQYQSGDGVAQDAAEAFRQFQIAADAGSVNGQFSLACRFLNGEGTAKNIDEGMRLLTLAADGGHPDAENAIATRYFSGNGVAQDFATAIEYFTKAADGGQVSCVNCGWVMSREVLVLTPDAVDCTNLSASRRTTLRPATTTGA